MNHLEVSTVGAVKTVTMCRPEKRNAIDPAMMEGLRETFSQEPEDGERVAVIRGEGHVFCAGLQLRTSGVEHDEAARIEAMFDAVQRYPLPVVAVVQGPAIAGGCELALHCDFVVAAEDAPFAMPLAQLGVATTWFLSKKLMEAAGPVTTREFLLLGEPLTGARLRDLGIVSRAAPKAALEEEALALVERLAANAPLAMRAMKSQIIRHNDFMMAIDHEDLNADIEAVYQSADAKEGVAARLEKRVPKFYGR